MRPTRVRYAPKPGDRGDDREIEHGADIGQRRVEIDREAAERRQGERRQPAIGHAPGVALEHRDAGALVAHRRHVAERGDRGAEHGEGEADRAAARGIEMAELARENEREAGEPDQPCEHQPQLHLRAQQQRAEPGVEQDDGRERDRREPARHVSDRDIEEDVVEREQQRALQREIEVIAQRIAQAQAAQRAPGEQDRGRDQEPPADRHDRMHRAELEADREPRRAPDRDRRGIEREVVHRAVR